MAPAIPAIMVGASVAATGLSVYSAYKGSRAEARAYRMNAKVLDDEAAAVKEKAMYEESVHRDKLRKLLSSQRALYAKAGVNLSEGSPLAVISETAMEGEEEAMIIRRSGEVEADSLKNKAKLQRFYGKQAKKSGYFGMADSFLSGLTQSGQTYTNYYGR